MYIKSEAKTSKFSKKSSSSRRIVQNQVIEKELTYLRNLIPIMTAKPNASKVTVINEAVKYIEQLEQQVLMKWAIHQRLSNQRSINLPLINDQQQQIRRFVSQSKFKKNLPKRIGKK